MQVSVHFILALVALLLASCDPPPAPDPDRPPPAVRTTSVRLGPVLESIEYVGTIRSEREVRVLARVAGTLVDLPAQEGDKVTRGSVVARVAAPESHARVQQVAAELRRASTERAYLCDRFDTDKRLADAGAMSSAQLDLSRKSCASSRAGESAARAAHAEVASVASKSTETAPLDGHVLQWLAEPGEHLLPGMPILLIGDDELEVRVPVAELDVERGIQEGMAVALRKGKAAAVSSEIASVAPMATGPGRTVEVTIPLAAGERDRFSHGQSVDVSFIIAERDDASAVPLEAIHHDGDDTVVFLVEDSEVKRRAVVLGPRDRAWVAVTPKLPEGTRVAVTGLSRLRDGLSVYAVSAEEGSR